MRSLQGPFRHVTMSAPTDMTATSAPRILLLGALGQVGMCLRPLLAARGQVTAIDRDDLDIADADALRAFVRALDPSLIVNAAAYTAVDRAETEPDAARAINATAPAILAEEAARSGARLVHYSTDYVYDGTAARPYVETDATAPLSVYGRTKLDGDEAILGSGAAAVILRTSWVYGPHGHNFLRTMLRLAGEGTTHLRVVADQRGTPTLASDLAAATDAILGQWTAGDGREGVYHATNEGETTWHGFAAAIFADAGLSVTVEPIPTAAYPTPAPRPAYGVLSKAKLAAAFGIVLPEWRDALATCLPA